MRQHFPFIASLLTGPADIVTIKTSEALALIGGTVELNCVSDGDPTPNVTWYTPDGSEIITITNMESTIVVDLENEEDFGGYKCKADNGLGPPVEKVIEGNEKKRD